MELLRRPTFQALALSLIYVFVFSAFCLLRHWSYNSWTLDLGIFTQSLYTTLQGNILYMSPSGMSQLGYHFQPILFLLVPVFWIAPYAETLLIVQTLALGFSGYLIYRLAVIQGLSHKAALIVEGIFFLCPLLHGVNLFDFHPVALAIPTLLIMIIGLVQRRWVIFTIGLVLSLMTKEDVLMALAVFGVVMLAAEYYKTRIVDKAYLAIFASSIATYAFAAILTSVISGGDSPMLAYGNLRYEYMDGNPIQIIQGAISAALRWDSIFLFLCYFWPLAFLPLLSPLWIAPVLFILGKDMAATEGAQKTLHQYPAAAIPFLFASFILVLRQDSFKEAFATIPQRFTKLLPIVAILMLLGFNFLVNLHPSSAFRDVSRLSHHDRAINAIIELIPDESSVTAPYHIFSHLSMRTDTYSPYEPVKPNVFHGEFGLLHVTTDYVIIDLHRMRDYKAGYEEDHINWEDYIAGTYGLLAHIDGISLLQRNYNGPPILTEINDTEGFQATIFDDTEFNNTAVQSQYFSSNLHDLHISGVIPGIVSSETWSMQLKCTVDVREDTLRTIHLSSDGGASLWINEELIIEPGVISRDVEVFLQQGSHEILLGYRPENGGSFDLNLGDLMVHRPHDDG
ncbi:MAG: DUF2079 domain-containing protein [Chloroflexota bacterium]|nr:DUF2079 domain-containing protein [Chloroflexota bacterium]